MRPHDLRNYPIPPADEPRNGSVMVEFTLREMSMNIVHLVRGAVKGALVAWTLANSRRLLVRLVRDEAGNNLVLFALLMPVLVGIAGLGTEGGLWLYSQQALQGAADSAAISAAWAYNSPTTVQTQAEAITATYGYVNGTNGVTVTAIAPATSGNYTAAQGYTCSPYPCAVEVTATTSLNPLFSSLWFSTPFTISAKSVAIVPTPQCILALGKNNPSGAVAVAFLAAINLTDCGVFSDSNSGSSIEVAILAEINATNGTVGTVGNVSDFLGVINPTPTTGDNAIPDPYASLPTPVPTVPGTYSPPTAPSKTCTAPPSNPVTTHVALLSGVNYCGPITVNNGGVLTSSNNSFTTSTTGATTSITVNTGGQLTFNSGSNCNCNLTVNTGAHGPGTVTFGSGTYSLNGSINVTGGTLTSNSGSTYNVNGGVTVSSGTVTLGSGAYNGNLAVTGGTVTLNSGTYTLYGGMSVSGGGAVTSNSTIMTMTGGTCVGSSWSGATCSAGSSSGTVNFGSGTYTMSQLAEYNSSTVNVTGGTYILNADSSSATMLTLNGSTLTGTGTVVFTTSNGSSKYPSTAVSSTNGTLNLIAPTTGATQGIVLFGNNSTGSNAMPAGTSFTFDVLSTFKVTGAVYLPQGALQFYAFDFSSENCTQIIVDTIDVVGLAYFGNSCGSVGTSLISASVPTLVE